MAQQPPAGFYVAAGIGANIPSGASAEPRGAIRNTLGNQEGQLRLSILPAGVMSLGYGFGNGIRVELEGSVRVNTVDRVTGFSTMNPMTQAQGQLWNFGAMANGFIDFDVGNPNIRPYAGLGIGYVASEFRAFRAVGNGQRLSIDSTDGNLAYQAIVGAAFPVPSIPGLSATAEYRFLGMVGPDYSATLTSGGATQSGRVEVAPYHHSILVGLRYSMGGPAPTQHMAPILAAPAPVAQPPAPIMAAAPVPVTRSFIVYFDLRSSALTARAREVVVEAAQAARAGGTTRIEVGGHTDRSGPSETNRAISLRRAEIVAAELRRQGVRRQDISVRGYGETQPAMQTADRVREQQNRRVEIILR